MSRIDWDHLRYVLALGRAGTLLGAAEMLGVNHTTVLRRLDALESQLSTRLFDRQRTGYEPTDAGLTLLEKARSMEQKADEIERQILGADRTLEGPLRVVTAFAVMEHLLAEPLAEFVRAYPSIEVEVVENAVLSDLSSRRIDLAPTSNRREADVAVRLSAQVSEHLFGRQLGMTQYAVYALRGENTLPQVITPVETLIRTAPWVTFELDPATRVYDRWTQTNLAEANVVARVDFFNAKAAMLRTGIGVGFLPTFMEKNHPEFIRISDTIPDLSLPLWIVTHPDLRYTARVRTFMKFVGDLLSKRLWNLAEQVNDIR
ncbi:LysR family transcriptional regulator [Hwanghaeella sp.]|uniref:LysR family transcriptional regulator n=1 Tax=Hwanghaeella sp. TaxID=2605943 RepID=UPI003CCBDC67